MSVHCIGKVLEKSAHAGTELLMLVVLADYSDDDGNSYPAVASLARKCRTTPRNVNYILNALQASGELKVLRNEGPKGTNRYRIVLSALGANPLKTASPLKRCSPLKPASSTPEAGFPKPLKPASDEPSLNRQEPSGRAKLPLCQHAAVVDLYHQHLPELPRAKLMTESRKKALQRFWLWTFTEPRADGKPRASTSEEALRWIGSYFARTRSNDFLMGRTERSGAHASWRCDLDFLLTDKGKRQVIERTEEAAA